MKLYGKDVIKRRLDDVAAKGRLPHAILFSGSSGAGKKTLAKYTAELFLCKNSEVGACGECAVCRAVENNAHPDVIFAREQCGGKYTAEDFRKVLSGTVVKPNNGELKIYVFEDCDTMRAECHNALLKIVEEPAAHLRFVFTCENTSVVPETVLSRVTEFEVPDTPVKDCEQALLDGGADAARARELSETFAGNIGKCREVLDGGEELRLIEAALKAAAAIGERSGFGLAAALSEQSGRAEFSRVMEYLSRILRDALSLKYGGETEFFGKKEAKKIAERFSEDEILNALDAAFETAKNEMYNLNLPLTAAYFSSRIL